MFPLLILRILYYLLRENLGKKIFASRHNHPRCAKCAVEFHLDDYVMRGPGSKLYHIGCFPVCALCGEQLNPGDRVVPKGDALMHEYHAQILTNLPTPVTSQVDHTVQLHLNEQLMSTSASMNPFAASGMFEILQVFFL